MWSIGSRIKKENEKKKELQEEETGVADEDRESGCFSEITELQEQERQKYRQRKGKEKNIGRENQRDR